MKNAGAYFDNFVQKNLAGRYIDNHPVPQAGKFQNSNMDQVHMDELKWKTQWLTRGT